MYAHPRPRRGGGPLRLPSGGCHRIRTIRRFGCRLAGGLLAFRAISSTAFAYRVLAPSGSYGYCAQRPPRSSRLRCAAPCSAVHQRRAAGSLLAPSSGMEIAPQTPSPHPACTYPKRTQPR